MNTSTPQPKREDHSANSEEAYRKVSSPYGFSMYDVAATAALEKASRTAQEIVRSYGFERIMPAMVDYPETFAERHLSEIFNIKDNSGERLALRSDITAQVIKGYVRQIENTAGHEVRKFYYAAPVYKDVRKNYPMPREIYQIGCEVIGKNAESHLPQLINISQKILPEIFKLDSVTELTHTHESVGLAPDRRSSVALTDIRLRNIFADYLGNEYYAAEKRRDVPLLSELLTHKFKIPEGSSRKLALCLFYPAPEQNLLVAARDLPTDLQVVLNSTSTAVQKLIHDLEKEKISAYWQPLSEPRSSYYSGIFFETFVPNFTEPIIRGGVYNDLVKRYTPPERHGEQQAEAGACGFALDLLSF